MAQATCSTLPSNASSRTHRLAVTAWVLQDAVLLTAKKREGDFWAAFRRETASFTSVVIGFSIKTCFPCCKAWAPSCECDACDVHTMTPSNSSPLSKHASKESNVAQLYFTPSSLRGTSVLMADRGVAQGSTTATTSASGWRCRWRRCQPCVHQPAPRTTTLAFGAAAMRSALHGASVLDVSRQMLARSSFYALPSSRS